MNAPLQQTSNRPRIFSPTSLYAASAASRCCGWLQQEQARAPHDDQPATACAKPPHSTRDGQAKSVIFLFMAGGPSISGNKNIRPKNTLLNKLNGKARPKTFGEVQRPVIKGEPRRLGIQTNPHSSSTAKRAVGYRICCPTREPARRWRESLEADAFVHSAEAVSTFHRQHSPGFTSMAHGCHGCLRLGSEESEVAARIRRMRIRVGHDRRPADGIRQASCPIYQPVSSCREENPCFNRDLPRAFRRNALRKTLALDSQIDWSRRTLDDEESRPA